MANAEIDLRRLETLGRELLDALGYDPYCEQLRETPKRWAKAWKDILEKRGFNGTTFTPVAMDELVLVSPIKAWSICAHHLLPFELEGAVAYLVNNRMVGASKLARAFQECAKGLMTQEEVVAKTAELVISIAKTEDVAVIAKGRHLCMAMRGAKAEGTFMVTSRLCGAFRENEALRAELLRLIDWTIK